MKLETADLTMVQELVLVKPYKQRFKKVEQTKLDDEANKGKDPKKDIMALKKVEEKVLYNMQTVEIVQIQANNKMGLVVGDVVIVDWRRSKEFDVFKNVYLFGLFEIIAKVTLT